MTATAANHIRFYACGCNDCENAWQEELVRPTLLAGGRMMTWPNVNCYDCGHPAMIMRTITHGKEERHAAPRTAS